MSFTFKESLEHLCIIGRYSWADPGAIHLSGLTKEEANKLVGFSLAFGPKVLSINGKAFSAYLAAPPLDAANLWEGKERDSVKPIPLTSEQPLLAALNSGKSPEEIGGKLFENLLKNLEGLRKFWTPDFDAALAAAWLYLAQERLAKPGFPNIVTPRRLEDALFQPHISARFIAAMRVDEDAKFRPALDAVKDAVKGWIVKLVEPEKAGAISDEVATALVELRGMLLAPRSPASSPSAFPGLPERLQGIGGKLPPTLGEDYRTLIGLSKQVRDTVECEPLFALIVVWYLAKVAGDLDLPEELLHKYIYSKHRDSAVLGTTEIEEDQQKTENSYNERMKTIFTDLELRQDDERGNALRQIVGAAGSDALIFIRKLRSPPEEFTRDELLEFAQAQFESLLAYGFEAGQELLDRLTGPARKILEEYERIGGVYGEALTRKALEDLAAKSPQSEKIWRESLAAIPQGMSGTELGDRFRAEFNVRLGERLAEVSRQWLLDQVQKSPEEKEEKGDLAADLQGVKAQYGNYLRQLGTSAQSPLTGPGVGRARRESVHSPTIVAKSGLEGSPATEGEPSPGSPKTLSESVGAASTKPTRVEVESGAPITGLTTQAERLVSEGESGESSDSNAHPPGISRFLKIMQQGLAPESPDAGEFLSSRDLLETVRRRIVNRLGINDDLVSDARARWRAMALSEVLLASPLEKSSLGKPDSSLGVFLLLQLVRHLGTAPPKQWEDWAAPTSAVNPVTDELDPRFAAVPIWEVYKLPANPDQAIENLAVVITYWRKIANAVMACKAYARDVQQAQTVLAAALRSNFSVTFYNESFAQHSAHTDVSTMCFASALPRAVDTAQKPVAPAAHVWITPQAGLSPYTDNDSAPSDPADGSIGALRRRYDEMLFAYLGSRVGGRGEAFSYPLFLSNHYVGALHGGADMSDFKWPEQDQGCYNLVMFVSGILSEKDSNRYLQVTQPHRHKLTRGAFYGQLYETRLGELDLQTRILTCALLRRATGKRFALQQVIPEVLKEDPLSGVLRAKIALRPPASSSGDEVKDWAAYSNTSVVGDNSEVGWNKQGLRCNLLEKEGQLIIEAAGEV